MKFESGTHWNFPPSLGGNNQSKDSTMKKWLCNTYYPGDPWLGVSRAPGSELVPRQTGCLVWEETSLHCTLLPESCEHKFTDNFENKYHLKFILLQYFLQSLLSNIYFLFNGIYTKITFHCPFLSTHLILLFSLLFSLFTLFSSS